MDNVHEKKRAVEMMLRKEVLLSPEFFKGEAEGPEEAAAGQLAEAEKMAHAIKTSGPLVFNNDILRILSSSSAEEGEDSLPDWVELEKFKVLEEKRPGENGYREALGCILKKLKNNGTVSGSLDNGMPKPGVRVLFNYTKIAKKKEIQDFVKYFNARFRALESILLNRQELSGPTSIARLLHKKDRENVSIIAIVKEKTVTANNNIMLTVEDPTGEIKVLISKSKPDLISQATDIVLDEVLGITGVSGNGIIFCSKLIHPDIPVHKEMKKSPDESYALFLSDMHFGSNTYLPDEFNRFIRWLRGEIGSDEQKERVRKVKYIFIVGDLVDGVGIYPGQESELVIKDIYEQYKHCAELLSQIPQHIQIIVCAGNHDGSRLSEPQPPLSRDFMGPLLALPNLTMLSNPSMVNIGASEDFPGFDVLLYHGYSFDYYVANVDSIRNSGGYDRADLIMRFLLQRRHLAPAHSSTLYEPDVEEDPLVITRVPDFFVSGHIHKVAVSNYRGVSLICGSCWQSMTSFQEKMGHHPEPARVPMVNLQTRETKILRF